MNYYLGIDGGGTKTKVCLINEFGTVLGFGEAGPSSIDTVSIQSSIEEIKKAIHAIPNPFQTMEISSVFVGLGGVISLSHKSIVRESLQDTLLFSVDCPIRVENDVENALASGQMFEEGIALIVGTGMVAYGKRVNGISHRAGGWGYKEGDAGSSYDVGLLAIRHAIKGYDKRIEMTPFLEAVASVIGLIRPEDIISIMDDLWEERTKIASLAKVVTMYANLGDPHAKSIVEHATDELALCVKAVYSALDMPSMMYSIIGSLGNSEGLFHQRLTEKIQSSCPKLTLQKAVIDPALGAALLAKKTFESMK
jgi:glucosamine kinase